MMHTAVWQHRVRAWMDRPLRAKGLGFWLGAPLFF